MRKYTFEEIHNLSDYIAHTKTINKHTENFSIGPCGFVYIDIQLCYLSVYHPTYKELNDYALYLLKSQIAIKPLAISKSFARINVMDYNQSFIHKSEYATQYVKELLFYFDINVNCIIKGGYLD